MVNGLKELKPTQDLGQMAVRINSEQLSSDTLRWAKHCILDWIGVTVGGAGEELTKKVLDVAVAEGAIGSARIIGFDAKLTASQAALINGTASHALDYDDVNQRMNGHPSVPVVPVLMALADEMEVQGLQFLTSFVAGYEVETLLAEMSGYSHYDKGWHGTATYGTFGAAAAASKLLGLTDDETVTALGIASTQAAGLKSMFGTMCKPLHAGKAASNGLFSARLAQRGFTSRMDAIECPQGFAATQAEGFNALPVRSNPQQQFAVEENLFKYHASCYLTHAGIDALKELKNEHVVTPEDIVSVEQYVPKTHFSVCNIGEPKTGLEVKFSMRHIAAMVLSGIDTGSLCNYTDTIAARDDLVQLRDKVIIKDKPFNSRMQSEVVVKVRDGRILSKFFDAGVPAENLDRQEEKLTEKFISLVSPVYGEEAAHTTLNKCLAFENISDASQVFTSIVGKTCYKR
ncbi:MAG: hypothetical protein CMM58_05700 [Rhodospirillaceae bacterium]|nr:hypothetical protein [Rhodospirillaceae bacterium]